ncbi:MAG: hypothetical protein GY815_05960 [Gammaproteobacteria bacterium]|nr:hypothetical protein [Gammaproteobacteria bacterium]
MRAKRRHPGHRGSLAILLAFVASVSGAAQPTHLLGFVDTFCSDELYCFELRVKPEFRGALGKRIKVRFGSKTRIFDPENYELTLAQQDIVPGSHLRLLVDCETGSDALTYRASYIWVGD